MKQFATLSIVLSIMSFTAAFSGTTGKIAGAVTDARSGEKLVSANVVVQGLNLGAATNADGYFVILNVPPGTYKLQASLLGYRTTIVANVRVDIDQTTEIKIRLAEEAVQQEEIMVVAERPVVQRDVAASTANITAIDVQKLPTASVVGVVALQAGIQTTVSGDLLVRGSGGSDVATGGGSDRTLVLLNGQALRDGRDNSSFTGISLTAIDNIQLTTGGWNAEYGQVRSGLVNIVTKEGNPSQYSVGVTARYRAAEPKHFGRSLYDFDSYFIRPYVDPAVCWTGTGKGYAPGAWDYWTRRQYQEFGGWNNVAISTLTDRDPTNDLTPQAAQKLFLWQHRRRAEVSMADYDIDAGFGGPLFPGVSQQLGNLRFYAAYRRTRTAYLISLSDSAYRDQTFQLKVTSDIANGMKLSVEGLYAEAFGTNDNNAGLQGVYRTPESIAENINYTFGSYTDARIFTPPYFGLTAIRRKMFGTKFTHLLSSETFYTVQLSMFQSRYNTGPPPRRNNARIYKFGNDYYVDEAPYGWQPRLLTGNYLSSEGIGVTPAFRMAGGLSTSRDNSIVTNYTVKIDYTSQIDKYNQLQVGGEFTLTDSDINYGTVDSIFVTGRTRSRWRQWPKQASAYVQDKLEFEGMIANLGVRLDYSYAGGEWYKYDPFSKAFSPTLNLGIDTLLQKEPTRKNVTISPRLGVAFPISVDSKLFFNYGHFRSLPTPENLFLIRRTTDANPQLTRLANPNTLLPRTIQYELGYEHNLFDQFLVRISGYYKDIAYETRLVTYQNDTYNTSFSVTTNNEYRDVRGFEITLTKNRGSWVQGFINYTYDVRSYGYFGYLTYNANRTIQSDYQARNVATRVAKPVPRPYARANVDFFTPPEFGPGPEGLSVLGDVRVNLVASWSSGYYFTWDGGITTPGLENNVQWRDYWNVDMRISKNFRVFGLNLQLFADISNLFNFRYMTTYGFSDIQDRYDYFKSLHLPSDVAGDVFNQKLKYPNIPGNDRPGDYRKDGVEFQPIVPVASFSVLGSSIEYSQTRPFYYVADRGKYYQLVNGAWQEVDQARLQKVLDDKAYIDMPNLGTLTFLNPRNIFYGVRLSFDF